MAKGRVKASFISERSLTAPRRRSSFDQVSARSRARGHQPSESPERRRQQVARLRGTTPGRTCWFPDCETLVEDDPTWRKYVGLCARCHRRINALAKGHGITVGQYRSLFMRQDGACGGCQRQFTAERRPNVDHCHDSGKVRGLLCHPCNVGLGQLGDDAEGLRRLIKYLDRAQVIQSGREPEWKMGRPHSPTPSDQPKRRSLTDPSPLCYPY